MQRRDWKGLGTTMQIEYVIGHPGGDRLIYRGDLGSQRGRVKVQKKPK